MIFPSRSQLASKQITRTGRAEAVTKEGLAATLLPARQPDQMGQRHPLRPVRPQSRPGPLRNGSLCCVGSGTGAVARQDLACLYPGFPPSCPCSRVRDSVSSSRHLARSMRISLTTRSCTLRGTIYVTYSIGAAFVDRPGAGTPIRMSAPAVDYSTASDRSLETTPRPFSLPLAV